MFTDRHHHTTCSLTDTTTPHVHSFAQVFALDVEGQENNGTEATVRITSGLENMLLDGNEIDAQLRGLHLQNNSDTDLIMVRGGGNVGIGVANPTARLHVEGDLRLGALENNNTYRIGVDAGGDLNFIGDGSALAMEIGDQTGRVFFYAGSDVSAGSGGVIQIGHTDDLNLGIDHNEIQARKNGQVSNFHLQHSGGNLSLCAAETGNVGIGLTNPNAKLHVEGDFRIGNTVNGHTYKIEVDPGGDLNFVGDGGEVAMEIEDQTGRVFIHGGSDINGSGGGMLQVGSENGLNMRIDNNEIQNFNNGGSSNLFIQPHTGNLLLCSNENGQVGIGVSSAASLPDPSFLLAVDGKTLTEEVMVQLSGSWPDYVFQEDYVLLSLEELEKNIQTNGHLPGIPSAAEVAEKGGIEVGEMQRKLLEKVEELSLYMIELNQKVKALEADNQQLKSQLGSH